MNKNRLKELKIELKDDNKSLLNIFKEKKLAILKGLKLDKDSLLSFNNEDLLLALKRSLYLRSIWDNNALRSFRLKKWSEHNSIKNKKFYDTINKIRNEINTHNDFTNLLSLFSHLFPLNNKKEVGHYLSSCYSTILMENIEGEIFTSAIFSDGFYVIEDKKRRKKVHIFNDNKFWNNLSFLILSFDTVEIHFSDQRISKAIISRSDNIDKNLPFTEDEEINLVFTANVGKVDEYGECCKVSEIKGHLIDFMKHRFNIEV